MSEQWFSLGRNQDKEVLVRAWSAGDGITCSSASARCRRPCGPPVASLETLFYGRGGQWQRVDKDGVEKRVRRVVCAEHLGALVGCGGYTGARGFAIGRAAKRATEEVVTKHWKQYQELYEKFCQQEMDELFSEIPDNLRALIEEAGTDGESDDD